MPYSRMSRRRLLQFLGCSVAGMAGIDILAACGGSNPPQPVNGTVTSNPGASRQVAPYFLGYNNVPIHSPSWDNPDIVNAAIPLKPGTLRYPGGTVANYWDWQSGWFVPAAPGGFLNAPRSTYRLQELLIAVRATGAIPIYVLNMLTSDLNTQLEMLQTAKSMGLPVQLVELGNEFYLSTPGDYVTKFPGGSDYGKQATSWISAIRAAFPDAKIAVVGGVPVTNSSNDPRKANWNQELVQNLQGADALTLHPYVPIPQGTVTQGASSANVSNLEDIVSARWQQFENVLQSFPPNMKVWFTEYNLVDAANQVFHTWIHGILVAEMSLNFLAEDRSELACYYDMIGKTGSEAIFYDRQSQGADNSPLPQFALTAAGLAMRLLADTMQGMTSARQISFSTGSASGGGGISPSPLQGWIFTDGTNQRGFIINSSSASFTWTTPSAFALGTRFQQLTGDPFKIITGPDSLTANSGMLGIQLVLPSYSVTQLKRNSAS